MSQKPKRECGSRGSSQRSSELRPRIVTERLNNGELKDGHWT